MLYFTKILTDGAILSLFASLWLMLALKVNPRIFLHDYPVKIQEKVTKKTKSERHLSYVFGVPFMLLLLLGSFFSTLSLKTQGNAQFWELWLNAAGVVYVFNIVDWLILDWLMFCTLIPRFVVIPGSEGMAEYKDYRFHFRGFLHGTVYSGLGGLIIAGIVSIPPGVAQSMCHFLEEVGANPGRWGHRLSIEAARVVYATREAIAIVVKIIILTAIRLAEPRSCAWYKRPSVA